MKTAIIHRGIVLLLVAVLLTGCAMTRSDDTTAATDETAAAAGETTLSTPDRNTDGMDSTAGGSGPMINGSVDPAAKRELLKILQSTSFDLDGFMISGVAKNDEFNYIMGLSSAEGIAVGTSCTAMMMTTPYSLVIATLADGGDAQAVREDFINSLDWQKWVCVLPTGALVAQKGNVVLCLMAADSLYHETAQAIAECGWENLEAIDRPF